MRHRKSGRHFNRTQSQRRQLINGLVANLMEHVQIKTTLARAKELRRHVEPLITLAGEDSVHLRRRAFAKLRDPWLVGKLFTEIGPFYRDRPGGYMRIIKAGRRAGDQAPGAYVQLVQEEFDAATSSKSDKKTETDKQPASGKPPAASKSEAVEVEAEVTAKATDVAADDSPASEAPEESNSAGSGGGQRASRG